MYHNMPTGPVGGRENVKKMIAGFIGPWTETRWDILNLVSAGDVVIAERLDRTKAGDKAVDLPCTGVFEMENGKIKVWRDYFDASSPGSREPIHPAPCRSRTVPNSSRRLSASAASRAGWAARSVSSGLNMTW